LTAAPGEGLARIPRQCEARAPTRHDQVIEAAGTHPYDVTPVLDEILTEYRALLDYVRAIIRGTRCASPPGAVACDRALRRWAVLTFNRDPLGADCVKSDVGR
jgi:hypothetical protein